VALGGGACPADNVQTLCVVCHSAKTKAEASKKTEQVEVTTTMTSLTIARYRLRAGPSSPCIISRVLLNRLNAKVER
jgi:hypothetical protein